MAQIQHHCKENSQHFGDNKRRITVPIPGGKIVANSAQWTFVVAGKEDALNNNHCLYNTAFDLIDDRLWANREYCYDFFRKDQRVKITDEQGQDVMVDKYPRSKLHFKDIIENCLNHTLKSEELFFSERNKYERKIVNRIFEERNASFLPDFSKHISDFLSNLKDECYAGPEMVDMLADEFNVNFFVLDAEKGATFVNANAYQSAKNPRTIILYHRMRNEKGKIKHFYEIVTDVINIPIKKQQ